MSCLQLINAGGQILNEHVHIWDTALSVQLIERSALHICATWLENKSLRTNNK